MITGKVNMNSDFFSNKVFKNNNTSKMFAKVIFPVTEQDEEDKLDQTQDSEKKARIGVDHKKIMRASLIGAKDIPTFKKSTGSKAAGITRQHIDRAEKYKSMIQNEMQKMDDDDSVDTDEEEKSSSSNN